MEYEIIATLGPSSSQPDVWRAMLRSGATAFRLNTSHLNLPQLHDWLARLQPFLEAQAIPLVLDLQGSKWRLGELQPVDLSDGQLVELSLIEGEEPRQHGALALPVPHADFFKAALLSDGEIVLNDAKVRLALERVEENWLLARTTQGGPLSARKGITFASSTFRTETLSEKDRAILEQTGSLGFVRCAFSYVKDAAEMARYRELTAGILEHFPYLIAKLERGLAMQEAAQIAQFADELWVCRGDLGAELGLRAMAESVHRFSAQVRELPVPAIMAGQVLEHMTGHPTPTRSEACYLYDTLQAGYRGFVLSDETAVGRDPAASCLVAATWKG